MCVSLLEMGIKLISLFLTKEDTKRSSVSLSKELLHPRFPRAIACFGVNPFQFTIVSFMSIRQPSSHKTVFDFLKQLRREIDGEARLGFPAMCNRHVDAQELYLELQHQGKKIGLATVYRALKTPLGSKSKEGFFGK